MRQFRVSSWLRRRAGEFDPRDFHQPTFSDAGLSFLEQSVNNAPFGVFVTRTDTAPLDDFRLTALPRASLVLLRCGYFCNRPCHISDLNGQIIPTPEDRQLDPLARKGLPGSLNDFVH